MEKSKKKPHRYKARMISGFTTLLLLVAVVCCLSVVLQSMSHGYVRIGRVSLFRVVTGSMEPTIPIGAVLLTRQTDMDQIEMNDVVCFRSTNPGSRGLIVTHRVVDMYEDPSGKRCLKTMGDRNLTEDVEPVTEQNLIGRVVWHTGDGSMMAKAVTFLTGDIGFLACVVLPVLLVAVWIFRDAIKSIKKQIQDVEENLRQQEKQVKERQQADTLTDDEYQKLYQQVEEEVRKEMEQHAQPNETNAQESAADPGAAGAAPEAADSVEG